MFFSNIESRKTLLDTRHAASGRLCFAKNPVTLTSAILACFLTSEHLVMKCGSDFCVILGFSMVICDFQRQCHFQSLTSLGGLLKHTCHMVCNKNYY